MLTYARVEDFVNIKEILTDEASAQEAYEVLRGYLRKATRLIDRVSRRRFFPWYERRSYTIPAEFVRLRMRTFPGSDLWLDADLLEIATVETGETGDLTELTEGTNFEMVPWNVDPKWALRLIWPTFWTGAVGRWRTPSIYVEGFWGYHEQYDLTAWINTNVNMGSDIDDAVTTFTIPQTATTDELGDTDIRVGEMLRIDDELMEVTDVAAGDPRTVTVVRAINGTTAAAHTTTDTIYKWHVHEDIVEACIQICKAWREHDEALGGRQGTSEMSAGVELTVPSDAKEIMLAYRRNLTGQGFQ